MLSKPKKKKKIEKKKELCSFFLFLGGISI